MQPPRRNNRGRKPPASPKPELSSATKRPRLMINPPKLPAKAGLPYNPQSSESTISADDSERTVSDAETIPARGSPKASKSESELEVYEAAWILFNMRSPSTWGMEKDETKLLWETIKEPEQKEKEAVAKKALESLKCSA